MRVVAGQAGGRPLRAPAGRSTRPTADRVREAIFSMLAAVTDLEGAEVVDLFAGSGAMGIEALSRGARRATFVETGAAALAAVRANLAALGFGPQRAVVVRADAVRWSAAGGAGAADVVFADPPYGFDAWPVLLAGLAPWAALAVVETGADLDLPAQWSAVRHRRYGATVVTIARPAPSPAVAVQPEGGM